MKTCVYYADNKIGEKGAEALLGMLAVNKTITGLGLDGKQQSVPNIVLLRL